MNRFALILALVAMVILGGLLYVLTSRSAPDEGEAARTPTPAAPAPEPPRPSASASPAREMAPRRPRAPRPPSPLEAPPEPAPEAAPALGTLQIDADVPGAQVFLDREFIGTAPVTASNVKPGQHRLNVSADGYEGFAETIDVEPGPREISVRFKEVRLNAHLDVVHKHRMGSCKGALVATAQGLRYETTDKDDAFSASLTELDVFQIDYLEKNLRVKPKKGKQYNFTDPDGNADRLFVFHRDVEKARDRLRKGDQPSP